MNIIVCQHHFDFIISDWIFKKGGEHESRPEEAQEDAVVHYKEENTKLPKAHQEPQHHGEPSSGGG